AATMLVLLTLVILVVAVTLVESAGDISEAESGVTAALWLAVYSSVQHAFQVLPIACFLGALVAGAVLARRGEILAAQAAGVSSLKLALSFMAVVLGASALGVGCGELLVPRAIAGVERVQREQLHHRSALSRFYNRRLKWFRQGDVLIFLTRVDREARLVRSPVVYRFEQGLIAEVVEAETLRYDELGWYLEKARVRKAAGAEVVDMEVVRLELTVRPTDLIDVTGDPRQMSSSDVRELIDRRETAGFDATAHNIELHNRFAMPLSAIWMFLVVAPWALHPERRRSLAVTLGAGVITIAALLSVTHMFRLMALGHKIPVYLGAWGAGLVSLAILPLSVVLYQRYRVRGSIF
ncbi:LptF/LptG family permease, partial [Myxococcota bacterium]